MSIKLLKPKVSILTSAYNTDEYIEKAITSVRRQTYGEWELIIINDGSTDHTEEIIKKLVKKDERIKYYKNEKNIGVATSLNKGISLSKGEFIALIDSDDVWINNEKLEKQIDYLIKNHNTVLIGSWGYKINSKDKKTANIKYPINDNAIRRYLFIENCFLNSSVVFRKKTVLQFGGYESSFNSAVDYALWLKLGRYGQLHNVPEYMVGYRTNSKGISMTRYDEQIASTIQSIKKYKKFYPHFLPALFLWYLRKIIPRNIREYLSRQVREQVT